MCGCNSIVQVPAWFIGVRVLNDHINDGKQAGKQTGREGGDVKSCTGVTLRHKVFSIIVVSYSSPYVITLVLESGSVSDARVASLQLLDSMNVPLCRSRSADLIDMDMDRGRLDRKLFPDNKAGSFWTQKLFLVTLTLTCALSRSKFSREEDSVICSKSPEPEDRLCPPFRWMLSRPA